MDRLKQIESFVAVAGKGSLTAAANAEGVAPAVIGLILGPMAEAQFRRAMTISQGDPSVFVTHPLSLALLVIALLVIIMPPVLRRMRR